VAAVFVEAGVSGSVPLADRPEGQRLLTTLRTGDVVITAKLDRMFRSAADALGTLEEIKDQGVALHMIDLGGDVCGNGISKLVFTILSAVAENERDRIRERIRDVKRDRASQHLFNGGRRPLGFDIDGEGKDRRALSRTRMSRPRSLTAGRCATRDIADAWVSEFGMPKFDAKSIQRMLSRGAES
jgi:putative DNA-invertase from lambdoid prophage Rac